MCKRQEKFWNIHSLENSLPDMIKQLRIENRRIDFDTRRIDRLSSGICSKSDIEYYSNLLNFSFDDFKEQDKNDAAVHLLKILHLNKNSPKIVEAILFFVCQVTIMNCNQVYFQLKDSDIILFLFEFLQSSSLKIQVFSKKNLALRIIINLSTNRNFNEDIYQQGFFPSIVNLFQKTQNSYVFFISIFFLLPILFILTQFLEMNLIS